MKPVLERYYLTRVDGRKTRWWTRARLAANGASASIQRIVSLAPGEIENLCEHHMAEFVEWVEANNLGEPPVQIMDRQSDAWKSNKDGFPRQYDRAYLAVSTGMGALAITMAREDDAFVVSHDAERGGWFARINDCDWGEVDDSPDRALKKLIEHLFDGLIDGDEHG